MRIFDDLTIRADLDILHYVMGEMLIKAKEDKEFIKVLLQLEQFVAIHKTRTNDMVTYRDTIERAREEYRNLSLRYRGLKETLDLKTKILAEVMNEKMDEDVNY